jgi:hypothetical protein
MEGRLADETSSRTAPPVRVGAYAWYALFVLVIVYIINFIDRQILSILVGDIKRDLGSLRRADRLSVRHRLCGLLRLVRDPARAAGGQLVSRRLMAMGLALWSSMTALSGFANSFGTLAAAGSASASARPALPPRLTR